MAANTSDELHKRSAQLGSDWSVADGTTPTPCSKAVHTFCQRIPKVELHAHLNGSIRDETIRQLIAEQNGASLTPEEAVALENKGSRTLADCFRLFATIHRITTRHDTITRITKEVVEDFAADSVMYLELRTTPKDRPEHAMTKESYVDAVLRGIEEYRAASKAREHAVMVKLLLSIDRREGHEEAMRTVKLAASLKSRGVVGVDLSGNPSVGSWSSWLPALQAARAAGLCITLHCGEVQNDDEVRHMLAFKPERLGHMCCMSDELAGELAASSIPVELCLTSNLKTESVPSYEAHHFQQLYQAGHPVVLCTDDSGVFATTLSQEYIIAAEAFALTERDFAQLVLRSIDYTFTSAEERAQLHACLAAFLEAAGLTVHAT